MNKRDVEHMLATYDLDPVGALTVALRKVFDDDTAVWPELVMLVPGSDTRRAALLLGDERTLDELLAELNERRGVS